MSAEVINAFQLGVLVHAYAGPDPFPWDGDPQALATELDVLCAHDLLRYDMRHQRWNYGITDRGRAYVEHFLRTPLPEMKWEVPA